MIAKSPPMKSPPTANRAMPMMTSRSISRQRSARPSLSVERTHLASVILKLVHPLAKGIGARWVWSRGRRYLVYMKLDPVKVAWIIRRKEAGAPNSAIASAMSVSERRVQSIWSVYRATGSIPELGRPGRKHVEATDQEKGIIEKAYA